MGEAPPSEDPLADTVIRAATAADAAILAPLVADLMHAEGKTTPPPDATSLAAWLGAEDPPVAILLAAQDHRGLGYLAFYRAFSLFKPGPVLLVENLYVVPELRGHGLARRLLAEAARTARARGWRRMELNVAEDNTAANATYAALGFAAPGESVRRLEDGALDALAALA